MPPPNSGMDLLLNELRSINSKLEIINELKTDIEIIKIKQNECNIHQEEQKKRITEIIEPDKGLYSRVQSIETWKISVDEKISSFNKNIKWAITSIITATVAAIYQLLTNHK